VTKGAGEAKKDKRPVALALQIVVQRNDHRTDNGRYGRSLRSRRSTFFPSDTLHDIAHERRGRRGRVASLLVCLRDCRQAAHNGAGLATLGQIADIQRDRRRLGRQRLKLAPNAPGGEIVAIGAVGGEYLRRLGLRPIVPGAFGSRPEFGGDRWIASSGQSWPCPNLQ
jgi:hypothetical protein